MQLAIAPPIPRQLHGHRPGSLETRLPLTRRCTGPTSSCSTSSKRSPAQSARLTTGACAPCDAWMCDADLHPGGDGSMQGSTVATAHADSIACAPRPKAPTHPHPPTPKQPQEVLPIRTPWRARPPPPARQVQVRGRDVQLHSARGGVPCGGQLRARAQRLRGQAWVGGWCCGWGWGWGWGWGVRMQQPVQTTQPRALQRTSSHDCAPTNPTTPNKQMWLHPQRYRTQLCVDGAACHRKVRASLLAE